MGNEECISSISHGLVVSLYGLVSAVGTLQVVS
jgi:hypothetical protein